MALFVSFLLSSLFGAHVHAREVQVRGELGAFRLEAQFTRAGDVRTLLDAFALSYDPQKLSWSLEDRYIRSIFGRRTMNLGAGDVELVGAERLTDRAEGLDGTYLVLRVRNPNLLNGYYGFGVEADEDGLPSEHARVVVLEGHLTGVAAILHNMVVGRANYYYRPIVNCQPALSAPNLPEAPLEIAANIRQI